MTRTVVVRNSITTIDPPVSFGCRLQRSQVDYITLAAAQLHIKKAEVVAQALKMHQEYFEQAGVIE